MTITPTDADIRDTIDMAKTIAMSLNFKVADIKIESSTPQPEMVDWTWTVYIGKEKDAVSSTVHSTDKASWREVETVLLRSLTFTLCVMDRPEMDAIVYAMSVHKLNPNNPLAAGLIAQCIHDMSKSPTPPQTRAILREVVNALEPEILPVLNAVREKMVANTPNRSN